MEKEENVQIVEDTIKELLDTISQKLKEEKISYYPKDNFHFGKIKFIESSEQGEIKLSYPVQQGTYHNYCEITIHKDGSVKISGVMTSPERRAEKYTQANGSFRVDLTLDEWQEPNSMDYIRNNQIGKYIPEKGILDGVSRTRINTGYMWKKIDEKFPETCDEKYMENNTYTYSWYGEGLPYVPCIEYFNEGTNLLIMTPEYATTILKKCIEMQKKGRKETIILYKNAMTGLSRDCFDISLGEVDLYVVENEGILEQSEEEKRQKYIEYRDAVLESIDRRLWFNYKGIINDDLRKDSEFVSKVEEILKRDEKQGYSDRVRYIRKQLKKRRTQNHNTRKQLETGKTQKPNDDLTYSLGETDAFKKAIQAMAEQSSDKSSDLEQITGRLEDEKQENEIQITE